MYGAVVRHDLAENGSEQVHLNQFIAVNIHTIQVRMSLSRLPVPNKPIQVLIHSKGFHPHRLATPTAKKPHDLIQIQSLAIVTSLCSTVYTNTLLTYVCVSTDTCMHGHMEKPV